jgi:hypothetical protein
MKLTVIYDYFANRFGSRITTPETIDIDDVDFHQLLARDGKIAAIWCIEDVKGIRPHLSDEQAGEVLEEVGRKHDADLGISWTTLEVFADEMFPDVSEDERAP